MQDIYFSIIVPVYNRPDEVDELLDSLSKQSDRDFEVVIVEDGSSVRCEDVCRKYGFLNDNQQDSVQGGERQNESERQNCCTQLKLKYFYKENSGRSETRNYGMERAGGNYFIIFDSDCVIPLHYIETVRKNLVVDYADCYGAPDNADTSFSDTQKAINYAMTSFFTTGGIRGGRISRNFTPRSFNMGFSREVYSKVGGFKNMIAEDIELSYRIKKAGFTTALYQDAFVYHKRRVSFRKMFRQVRTFGKGRVLLRKVDRRLLKPVHLLPSVFVVGNLLLLLAAAGFALAACFSGYSSGSGCGAVAASICASTCCCAAVAILCLAPIVLYALLIFTDAAIRNKSIKIGAMSIIASYIQLTGYGLGMIVEFLSKSTSKKKQEELYR